MKPMFYFPVLGLLRWSTQAGGQQGVSRPINEYFNRDYYSQAPASTRNDLGERGLIVKNFFVNDIYAVRLTQAEFDKIANMNTSDQTAIQFANSKGIYFDTGLVPLYIDRQKAIMVTLKNDFGTILSPDTIQDVLGAEIRKHYERFQAPKGQH